MQWLAKFLGALEFLQRALIDCNMKAPLHTHHCSFLFSTGTLKSFRLYFQIYLVFCWNNFENSFFSSFLFPLGSSSFVSLLELPKTSKHLILTELNKKPILLIYSFFFRPPAFVVTNCLVDHLFVIILYKVILGAMHYLSPTVQAVNELL